MDPKTTEELFAAPQLWFIAFEVPGYPIQARPDEDPHPSDAARFWVVASGPTAEEAAHRSGVSAVAGSHILEVRPVDQPTEAANLSSGAVEVRAAELEAMHWAIAQPPAS